MSVDPDSIITTHLGHYDRETANEIAGELEEARIFWWYKEPGWVSQMWEFGVRLFVDRSKFSEARTIAGRVSARRQREIDAQRSDDRE